MQVTGSHAQARWKDWTNPFWGGVDSFLLLSLFAELLCWDLSPLFMAE